MRAPCAIPALLALLLPLLAATSGARAAGSWEIAKVALQGEAAPGTGETFEAFDVSRESGAAVLFVAMLSGTPPSWVLYRYAGGAVVPLVLPGTPAPGAGGASYHVPLSFPSGSAGDLSFASLLTGGVASRGLFADTGSGVAPVFLEGDAAPGGGTFAPLTGELTLHDRNGAGEVVFVSSLSGAPTPRGLFRASGGALTAVDVVGGGAPGGGTWTDLRHPTTDDAGRVAFVGGVSDGAAPTGLFVRAGGTTTPLALVGDSAPGTGGGTFDAFHYPFLQGDGSVLFLAGATGGAASGGLFRASGAGTDALLVENDPIPDTGDGLLTRLDSLPTRSADGALAFGGGLSGGTVSGGVFLREADGTIRPVALAGEPAPDAGGATFASFGFLGLDEGGAVAFQAELSDGRSGLFSATPSASVPLPGPAAALLALLLARTASLAGAAPRGRWRPPRLP